MSTTNHKFHIANKVLRGRCSTKSGIDEFGEELTREVFDRVEEFKNNPINYEWEKLENHLQNPTIAINSYVLANSKEAILRSYAVIPKYYMLVKNILERIDRIVELIPTVIETETVDDFFINNVITMDATCFYGRITHSYRFVEISPQECAHVFSHFQQGFWKSYMFYAKEDNRSTSFVVQSKFCIDEKKKGPLFHFINLQRKLIHNIYDHISGEQEAKNMMFLERTFNKMVYNQEIFPVILYRNAKFNVFANYDFTEIVIKGSSDYNQSFKVIVEDLDRKVYSNIMYSKSELLKKGKRQQFFHSESPYFGLKPVSTDMVVGNTVVEGNVFICCQTTSPAICNCHYHHEEPANFAIVLSAERTETFNGKAKCLFYHHYFVPTLNLSKERASVDCIKNVVISRLIMRIGFEQNVPLRIDKTMFGEQQMAKNLLSCSLQIKRAIEERKRIEVMKIKNCIKPVSECYITKLDENVLYFIMKKLCLEDLISLRYTSHLFFALTDKNIEVWKNFYDLHYNPLTQSKQFFNYEPNETINYPVKVIGCFKTSRNWKNKKWNQRNSLTPFFAPINFSKIKSNDCVVVGSENGYFTRLESRNGVLKKVREGLPMKLIAGIEPSFDYSNDLLVYFRSGEIRKYTQSALEFSKFEGEAYERVSFMNNCTVVGLNETSLSVLDFVLHENVVSFIPHSVEITHFCSIDSNTIVSSSIDGTIAGYDVRSNRPTFRTINYREEITSFNWIDDYVVTGTSKGRMRMWDLKMNSGCCCERTVHSNRINSIFCYNRKMVSGGTDRSVYCCDLSKGWFENIALMYMHQSPITTVSLNDNVLVSGSQDGVLMYSKFC